MLWQLYRDGEPVGEPVETELAALGELHRLVGYSAAHALKYEGWEVSSLDRTCDWVVEYGTARGIVQCGKPAGAFGLCPEHHRHWTENYAPAYGHLAVVR